MRQVNLKSDRIATLLEQIAQKTGETKVEVVAQALEKRLQELETTDCSARTLTWLETTVWPKLSETQRGQAPSKEEQEELLGF